MRKHEYQLVTPGREDARKERRRSRIAESYRVETEPFDTNNMPALCPSHGGRITDPESHCRYAHTEAVDPESAKLVYQEAARMLLRDSLQITWGRVQQKEELDYEPIVALVAKLRRARPWKATASRKVLEEFDGFVDKFDADVAHVTLKTKAGETFYGEYPAVELKAQGIRERRRFKCWTIEVGAAVEFVMEAIPDKKLSEDDERMIDDWLLKSLGEDDAPQNDH